MVSTAACCSLFPLDVAGYAARKPGADFVGWGRGWVWGGCLLRLMDIKILYLVTWKAHICKNSGVCSNLLGWIRYAFFSAQTANILQLNA